METINEFATKYAQDKYLPVQTYNAVKAGANYVLEEIENVIKSDRIFGHPFPSLEMRYNQIISVIEQLKK